MADVHEALKGITPDDLHIDAHGRAVITHPELVKKLAAAGVTRRPDISPAAGNIICTGSMPAQGREVLEAIRGTGGGNR